jgi:signal transduction histidine kinase
VPRSRWWPVGLAVVLSLSVLAAWLTGWDPTGWIDAATTLLPVPVAFACGLLCERWPGLAGTLSLAVILEVTDWFNPFVLVITLGPWLAGAIFRDRQQLARRLERVSREIEAESLRVTDEAVRLERSRIARELHDIVAHCVSMMVVQAYAGERLVGADQTSAAEAFDHISDAAGQARREIAQLVDLLAADTTAPPDRPLGPALRALVEGAAAVGLDVTLHLFGDPDNLPGASAAIVYRVAQEGITNAVKHAPGAPIWITVDCPTKTMTETTTETTTENPTDTTIDVVNASSTRPGSPLRATGGGRGLSGIEERVTLVGGTFDAGPERAGAWRISVRVPST